MSVKAFLVMALAAPLLVSIAPSARAQPVASPVPGPELSTPPPLPHPTHGAITIHPGRLLYRRCVDWYELQHRPSGTVLFPQKNCWWVRG